MVRINKNFALKQIVDEYIVIATGDKAVKFSSVLVLNEVGAKVFKLLQAEKSEQEIAAALMAEYGIDEVTAAADTKRFVDKLIADGVCSRE